MVIRAKEKSAGYFKNLLKNYEREYVFVPVCDIIDQDDYDEGLDNLKYLVSSRKLINTMHVMLYYKSNTNINILIQLQGSAQVSLADFSPESPSVKWYNILSFRFMQPSDSPSTSTSNNASTSVVKQAKHDKQESDISVYRSTQNTKEESSDESTIISSQTSTLTRNQGCDELQTAVSLRLEELTNCMGSPDEEDEGGGSGSGSGSGDSNNEEDVSVDFMIEDNVLEDVLEHEVSEFTSENFTSKYISC